MTTEQRSGEVIAITADHIKYKNPDNPGPVYTALRNKTILLFNNNGCFLVMADLTAANANLSNNLINNFLHFKKDTADHFDKVFTLQGKQLNCTVLQEGKIFFLIAINDVQLKIDRSTVAAIIYKNGTHEIVSPIDTAANILSTFRLPSQNTFNSTSFNNGNEWPHSDSGNYKDVIQYRNLGISNCKVLEVNDSNIVVDSNYNNNYVVISLDSIAGITYSNGYKEKYNDPYTLKHLSFDSSMIKLKESVKRNTYKFFASLKESHLDYHNDGNTGPPSPKEIVSLFGNHIQKDFTISTIGKRNFIGIGQIFDSATNMSRSFAFYELFRNNLLANGTDTLFPVMVDYQFNAPYAITGTSADGQFNIILYRRGVKLKEITADSWQAVYAAIEEALNNDDHYTCPPKFKAVNEGVVDNIDARKIKDCLPGYMELPVPYNDILDTLSNYLKLKYYHSANNYIALRDLYGKYSKYKEDKLFFFRNENIPSNLKEAARPFVFPLYKSLIPCITYLSSGKKLADSADLGGAINCYYSSLNTANNVLASLYDRAFIRYLTFEEIAKVHILISNVRIYTSQLFQLGANMNQAFINSSIAQGQRSDYYGNVDKVKDLCTKAEETARQIRGQKRIGGLLAAMSLAGSIATANPYDNTASNAYLDQSKNYINSSMAQADQVSEVLNQQYANIEDKINAQDFFATDGSTVIELGKPYVSAEVYYYLNNYPDLVKDVLLSFANNKPKLRSLLNTFYSGKKATSTLEDIYSQFVDIEKKAIKYEVRNMSPIPKNVVLKF
ncbi:MAG TPA: hypothetical protein VK718_10645 [Ferruginibacter sp.]|nr:hypothetical protein [Ferruginibacter sp.]